MYWKTDDQPDHIPKWDDPGIQAEVLRVWKLDEARKLAQQACRRVEGRSGGELRQVAEGIGFRQEEGFQGPAPAAVHVF